MLKILVVDDENLVRVALRSIVNWEEHGFDFVGTAGDGLEAISMVEKYNPDIVITDLKMPKMDGIQLIKSLKERRFGGKILVLSNYGEFELVKQALMLGAVDFILKVTLVADDFIALLQNIGGAYYSEKEMQDKILDQTNQIKQSKSIIKNNFFKELFNTEVGFNYQRITTEAREAGLKTALSKCYMYYIYVDDYEKALGSSKIEDRKQLVFSMRNIINEYLQMISDIQIIEIDYRRVVVIVPSQELRLMENAPGKIGEKIAGLLKLYVNIEVSIVVSTEFEGFYGAKTMYGDCVKALNLKFYNGNGSIICIDEIKINTAPEKNNFATEICKIWPCFEQGNIKEAFEMIKGIMEIAKQECYDPVHMKKYIMRLVEGIEIEVYKSNAPKELVFENKKEQIYNTETMTEFLQLVSDLLINISGLWKKDGAKNYRKEVNEVIQFINHHYGKKITIQMIASHVNLNESYICRVFKSEANKSIFTYINEVRMEKAAALLKDRDVSIKDIASEVGIDDQFYFNRVFKKHFGVNPTGYKNSQKKN